MATCPHTHTCEASSPNGFSFYLESNVLQFSRSCRRSSWKWWAATLHACARVQRQGTLWPSNCTGQLKRKLNPGCLKMKYMCLCRVVPAAAVWKGVWWKAPLTETQGLELVLGVGERCTVTSAIQWPGSGHHLRASKGGETSIIVLRTREPSRSWVVCLRSFFSPSVASASLFRSDGWLFDYSPAVSFGRHGCACAAALTWLSLSILVNRVFARRKQSWG